MVLVMMYAKLILIPILLIGECAGQNFDDVVSSVFDPPTPAPIPLKPAIGSRSYSPCGEDTECVNLYLCANGKVNNDGVAVVDIRSEEEQSCPFLQTCCAIEDTVAEPITVSTPEPPTGCGYRNVDGIAFKIVGAKDEAEFGEFPWMVAILHLETVRNKIFNVYQCGGSLITPQVVLTGAHCVQARQAKNFKVRAGEWETNTKSEIFGEQDRQVMEIIVHENYNKDLLHNDIALLFLDAPFDLAPNVNTVCLPPASQNFDTSRCLATGWGKNQFENGEFQNILKKIDLPVVPNAKCQENLRSTRLGTQFELHSSFMCAGGEGGKDTCKGDGGSPLVCPMSNNPDRYFLAGIVSWGLECGEENVPGVYANIPHLRSWIDEQLANKNIDAASYTPTVNVETLKLLLRPK